MEQVEKDELFIIPDILHTNSGLRESFGGNGNTYKLYQPAPSKYSNSRDSFHYEEESMATHRFEAEQAGEAATFGNSQKSPLSSAAPSPINGQKKVFG
jgi:hypothetical protein